MVLVYAYLGVGLAVAIAAYALGRVFKERLIGGGVRIGPWNAFLVGLFWPLFLLAIVVGKCYDLLQTFRKI